MRTLDEAPTETVKVVLGQLGNAASAGAKAAPGAGAKAWNGDLPRHDILSLLASPRAAGAPTLKEIV